MFSLNKFSRVSNIHIFYISIFTRNLVNDCIRIILFKWALSLSQNTRNLYNKLIYLLKEMVGGGIMVTYKNIIITRLLSNCAHTLTLLQYIFCFTFW